MRYISDLKTQIRQNCAVIFSKPSKMSEKQTKKWSCPDVTILIRQLVLVLTVCSKHMFSLREPTQPQNVMKNIRMPSIISNRAGSTVRQASAVSVE